MVSVEPSRDARGVRKLYPARHGGQGGEKAGGGVAVHHAHEKGVRHVAEGGHQHADDAGKGQTAYQAAHRRLGHLPEFLLMLLPLIFHEMHLSQQKL